MTKMLLDELKHQRDRLIGSEFPLTQILFDKTVSHIEQLQQRVGELEGEREALAAHVERFKKQISILLNVRGIENFDEVNNTMIISGLSVIKEQSPQTSLAEVRAKQAEESFIDGYADGVLSNYLGIAGKEDECLAKRWAAPEAKKHAAKIRNGKDGE